MALRQGFVQDPPRSSLPGLTCGTGWAGTHWVHKWHIAGCHTAPGSDKPGTALFRAWVATGRLVESPWGVRLIIEGRAEMIAFGSQEHCNSGDKQHLLFSSSLTNSPPSATARCTSCCRPHAAQGVLPRPGAFPVEGSNQAAPSFRGRLLRSSIPTLEWQCCTQALNSIFSFAMAFCTVGLVI